MNVNLLKIATVNLDVISKN